MHEFFEGMASVVRVLSSLPGKQCHAVTRAGFVDNEPRVIRQCCRDRYSISKSLAWDLLIFSTSYT